MNYNTDNPKFHEEVFSEVGEVVQLCYNYLNDDEAKNLDNIYIIGSTEEDWPNSSFLFQIQKKFYGIHQIKDKNSYEAQKVILDGGINFMKKLKEIFETYNQKVPTQIKVQFFAEKEKVKYNFEYDLIWSNREDCLPDDIAKEWFEEIKRKSCDSKNNFN